MERFNYVVKKRIYLCPGAYLTKLFFNKNKYIDKYGQTN
jgi:hypothetical protein